MTLGEEKLMQVESETRSKGVIWKNKREKGSENEPTDSPHPRKEKRKNATRGHRNEGDREPAQTQKHRRRKKATSALDPNACSRVPRRPQKSRNKGIQSTGKRVMFLRTFNLRKKKRGAKGKTRRGTRHSPEQKARESPCLGSEQAL